MSYKTCSQLIYIGNLKSGYLFGRRVSDLKEYMWFIGRLYMRAENHENDTRNYIYLYESTPLRRVRTFLYEFTNSKKRNSVGGLN